MNIEKQEEREEYGKKKFKKDERELEKEKWEENEQ